MTPKQVTGLEGKLTRYLKQFDDFLLAANHADIWWSLCVGNSQIWIAKSSNRNPSFPDQINRQPWGKCHIKETEKGPIVWEHRSQHF